MGFANRGTFAEKKVKEFLEFWEAQSPYHEAHRLTDAKAAGRVIKAAAADFEYYCNNEDVPSKVFGLIEVKETEHDYRLGRERVTQLPRLRKREKCGGTSYVLVYHSTLKLWRALTVDFMMSPNDKGSWDLRGLQTFDTCGAALAAQNWGAFHL